MRHHPRPLPSSLRLLAPILLLAATVPASLAQAPATEPETPEPPSSEAAAPSGPAETRSLTGIWWNRPRLVAALALTDEQRARMDAALSDSLAERRKLLAVLRDRQRDFADRVTQGERAAAEQAADALARATAEVSRFEARIKIDVLAHLSASQRQRLDDDYPRLLLRPWVRQEAVRRGMAPRGGERHGRAPNGAGSNP